MNLLEFEQLMTGANMPRCLQRGALFDFRFYFFSVFFPDAARGTAGLRISQKSVEGSISKNGWVRGPLRPAGPPAKLKASIDGPEKGEKDKRVNSGTYLDLIFPEALPNQDLLYTPGMIALQLDNAVALNGPAAGKLRFEKRS